MRWQPIATIPWDQQGPFDVWQTWYNSDTGEKCGRRVTNCWLDDGKIFHGKESFQVGAVSHWMVVTPPGHCEGLGDE